MNKKTIFFVTAILYLLLNSYFLFSKASEYENKIVQGIEFLGLVKSDPDDLNEIIRTTVGYPLKAYEVRQDVKDIFAQGYFEKIDVKVKVVKKGVKIRFICQERPFISEVEFRGLDNFTSMDFKDLILFQESEFLRVDLIKESLEGIKDKYYQEGFFNVVVNYRIEDLEDSPGEVKVIVIVDEGEEIKVAKIIIRGAEQIEVGELYDLMETKEESFLDKGIYSEDLFEEDQAKIIKFYKQQGYLDARIIFSDLEYKWENPLTKEKRVIFLTFRIREGEKYYFDKYEVQINPYQDKPVYSSEIFYDLFSLQEEGEIFDNDKFEMDRQLISFKYASRGYLFTRVRPVKKVEVRFEDFADEGHKEKRKFIKVKFIIDEGSQAYVDSFIVKGNKKTKDKVILREMILKEGELYDAQKMERSRERIYNLGFFKEVNFDMRPGSRNGFMNLIIDVEEQPTGTISLGGGYGTTSGFSIFTNIGEKNLFGNGQEVNLKFEYGPQKSSITLSFLENWLLNYPVGFSSSVFYNKYKIETTSIFPNSGGTAEYEKESVGYSTGLNYRFWYFYTIGTRWEHAFKNYINPTGNSSDEVFNLVAQDVQQKRTVSFYAFRDSKDNYLNPTRGTRIGATISFTGGFLKGDDHFIELKPKFFAYYSPFHIPFLKNHPCVFEFRAGGTFIRPPWGISRSDQDYEDNKWLETEDRLTIGGFGQGLRSWSYQDNDFPLSWQGYNLFHKILSGLEFRIPIHPQMLWLVFFFDAGSLWSDKYWEKQMDDEMRDIYEADLADNKLRRINSLRLNEDLLSYFRYSYGFGFKIQIPMMPLRFWFGRKMIYADDEFRTISDYNFDFEIGDIRF
jgi:outer membrane protein insertion porin family